MTKITDESFESEIKGFEGLALLEFYSDSCIPCKRMAPVLAEIEEAHQQLKVFKYNVNTDSKVSKDHEILATPTILFFKNGEEKERIRGILKKTELEEIVQTLLL